MCSKNNVKDFDDNEPSANSGELSIVLQSLTGKVNITFPGKKNGKIIHVVVPMVDSAGVKLKEIEIDAKLIEIPAGKTATSPRNPPTSPRTPKSPTSPRTPKSPTFPRSPRTPKSPTSTSDGGVAFTSPRPEKERALDRKKLDAVLSIVSGKIYRSHELVGKDDGFVKVEVGDYSQQTNPVDNSLEPIWNENLYFENIYEDEAANAEVSILDYDMLGPPCFIGSAKLNLLDFAGGEKHVTLPVFNKDKQEGELKIGAVLLPVGGAAVEKQKAERIKQDKAARIKADKAAAERAKQDEKNAKEKAKQDENVAKEKAKQDEKAAKEKAKADEKAAKEAAKAAKYQEKVKSYSGAKKDAVLSIVSGKIYKSHELLGKDDGFVQVTIGDVVQKTTVVNNSQEPIWNENLYFESVPVEDVSEVEVAVLDSDLIGPPCLIGTATISLLEYADEEKLITVPVFNEDKQEGELRIGAVLLPLGGAAKERQKANRMEADKLAKVKAEKEKAKADKLAAEAAEKAAKEKAKADEKAAKEAAKEAEKAAKEAEKAAKEKAKADEKAAKEAAKEAEKAAKEAEKAAKEKAKADAKAAEKAAKEAEKAAKEAAKEAEAAAKEKAKADAKAAVVAREMAIEAKGNKLLSLVVVRGEIMSKMDVFGKGDPFVRVEVGKEKQNTQASKGTQHPSWNQDFTFEHVNDLNAQNIVLSILDHDTASSDDSLGKATLSAFPYMDNKQHITLPIVDTKGKGTLLAKLELDVLLEVEGAPRKKPKEGEKRGVIMVKSGTVYEKQDALGKGDPFVRINLGTAEQQTSVKNNTLTPSWNEKLYFENIGEADAKSVLISILDHDPTKDDLIGTAVISLLPFKNKKGPISVALLDAKKKEQAKVELEVALEVEAV